MIERAKSGFLGFGSNPAKVRVSYEEEDGTPRPRKSRRAAVAAELAATVSVAAAALAVILWVLAF